MSNAPDDSRFRCAAADVALAVGDVDGTIAHLAAAIREFEAAGDNRSAAMACSRLGYLYTVALGNKVAGRPWFARAVRLVEHEEPCVEQGWVAVAAMGCEVDDPDVLLERAELALDRARRFGDVHLEVKALADGGLAHVEAGRVADGMTMLDEAMALACGAAVDDVEIVGTSVCSFYTACYTRRATSRASRPGVPCCASAGCWRTSQDLLRCCGATATASRARCSATSVGWVRQKRCSSERSRRSNA